jgi:hypothetical protein
LAVLSVICQPLFAQSPQVGDNLQGGIIFWLDGNGGGLIAAPSDLSTNNNYSGFGAEWGSLDCYGISISGAYGTAIGTGNQNTIAIEAGCTTPGTAADICANLTLGGYSDWYLPSKDELNEMYLNKGIIGGFSSGYYWSSTEKNSTTAWMQVFYGGTQYSSAKSNGFNARAVRAF